MLGVPTHDFLYSPREDVFPVTVKPLQEHCPEPRATGERVHAFLSSTRSRTRATVGHGAESCPRHQGWTDPSIMFAVAAAYLTTLQAHPILLNRRTRTAGPFVTCDCWLAHDESASSSSPSLVLSGTAKLVVRHQVDPSPWPSVVLALLRVENHGPLTSPR